MNNPVFTATECILCGNASFKEMHRSSLNNSSFTAYTFSARRDRKRENYRIVKCEKCSLVRSNPIIEESLINELYAESKFISEEEAVFAAKTYKLLLSEMITKYNIPAESLVEIGCSTGFFLEKAKQLGIPSVIGFEPSRDCVSRSVDSIKPFIINDIFRPNLLNGEEFDIGCLFHVIDHLRSPVEVLSNLRNQMHEGGYVFIVAHDVESLGAKILGTYCPIFDIEHIYLFSQSTITKLLEKSGFEPVETGNLFNVYPIGYWMRMLPLLNRFQKLLPELIRRIPFGIKAGNLYALGRKTTNNAD